MKSNALREFIKSKLDDIAPSYYQDAIDNALYPHIVFEFDSIDLDDYYRDDYTLTIDVWYKNNQFLCEKYADDICDMFNANNAPQSEILPTFYRTSRRSLKDEDKDINHIQLRFLVQNYAI